jgi:hypothetical protein
MFLSVYFEGRSFDQADALSIEEWQIALEPVAGSIPSVECIEFANMKAYWVVDNLGIAWRLCGISKDDREKPKKRWSKLLNYQFLESLLRLFN